MAPCTTTPKIAIIGAGPSGLMLARLLLRNDIPCTVYELDVSRESRNQGGTLDLHPEDGQEAMKQAGLWDQFTQQARPESDVMKVVKASGQVLWDENKGDGKGFLKDGDPFAHRPEIDRIALRNILIDSLPADSIKWGMKLKKPTPAASGSPNKHDLHFADGTVEPDCDLVVGADGSWSHVRPLITDGRPFYSGVSAVELWALDVETQHPWVSQFVGAGSCFMFDEGRSILAQRNGDHSIRVYACLKVPETWSDDCGIDWTKKDAALRELLETYFGTCSEDLKRLVLESHDEVIVRRLFMLPTGFSWAHRPGATLMGDAAHCFTPFAGEGVNLALADGLALAKRIVGRGQKTLDEAVREFEEDLFPRAAKPAAKTERNLKKHFSADGGDQFAAMLRSVKG